MKRIGDKWSGGLILCIIAVFLMVSFAVAQDSPYDKGVHAYLKKDFRASVKYLKEYVEQKPDPYVYYLLGYASYEMKNYPESREYFKQAYFLDPAISPTSVKEFLKKRN
jgi:tetratricopeptide (TPR) repeat protein